MPTIKKNLFTSDPVIFEDKKGKIKYWVDIQPEQIEIKVYSNEDYPGLDDPVDIIILWDIIKISELQKKPGFVDQTLWTRRNQPFLVPAIDGTADAQGNHFNYIPTEITEPNLVDMFGMTVNMKPKGLTNASDNYVNALYTIFAADTTDFTNCTLRLMFDAKYEAGFEVEGPSASSFVNEHVNIQDLVAPITLSSTQSTVTANSSISVTVNSQPYIDEVYLESVSGILNKTRVKLTNGVGKFSIMTTDLEVGEEIRVKAGHRKWTGIASFSKQIS